MDLPILSLERIIIKILKVMGIIVLILVLLMAYGIYSLFFDMSALPIGVLISEVESTNDTYSVKAYLVNPHATVAYCIRVELIFNKRNRKPKNIYWQYREEKANIYYIDDQTVSINGKVLKGSL